MHKVLQIKEARKRYVLLSIALLLIGAFLLWYIHGENQKNAALPPLGIEDPTYPIDGTFETQGRCYGTVHVTREKIELDTNYQKCAVSSYDVLRLANNLSGQASTTYILKKKNGDCIYDTISISQKKRNIPSFEIGFHLSYYEDPAAKRTFIDNTTYCAAVKI